jgi:choloylglycine hydrolase
MRRKVILFFILPLILWLGPFLAGEDSCSTFMLKHGSEQIFGHNLDMPMSIEGIVVVNKRNVFKKGKSFQELISDKGRKSPDISWTSKYGSITVNPFPREFPDGGMNEAGLCIWEMTLMGTKFMEDESLPTLFMMQWMQYCLDNFDSVDQVLKSTSEIAIDGWAWHFFTGDRTGKAASIEFLDGEVVIHSQDKLPVTALCNTIYAKELENLKEYEGFGGTKPIDMADEQVERFVHAAKMLKDYDPSKTESIVDYGFDVLGQLERGGTQWSIICDMKRLRIYFKTSLGKSIKYTAFDSFDFSNKTPAKILDINADLSGDVTGKFADSTTEANRNVARKVYELFSQDPGFEKQLKAQGITGEIFIERLATYADTTVNKE